MARNEEKQLGRLNRLWLQREREEGRIKDVERRPKLSTLNSASAVKKWIPSIKSEIEYYLQQSQLSHYPERKIAEFQLCIEGLEKEYKRFRCKLRALDPSCKHQPWAPRAYTKRRADTHDTHHSHATDKKPRSLQSSHLSSPVGGADERTGSDKTSAFGKQERTSQSEARPRPAGADPTGPSSATSETTDQDQPLSFDRTRLAVALAGSRGPVQPGSSSHTHSLARVLLSGLPNLHSSPLGRAIAAQSRESRESTQAGEERTGSGGTGEGRTGEPPRPGGGEERTGHLLGLGCYSSSDEGSDT